MSFRRSFTKECYDTRSITFVRMGNVSGEEIIPIMIDMYKRGMFPLDKLITFYPFEKINEAFRDSLEGKVFKPVLLIGD